MLKPALDALKGRLETIPVLKHVDSFNLILAVIWAPIYYYFNVKTASQINLFQQALNPQSPQKNLTLSQRLIPWWSNAHAIGKYVPKAQNAWLHPIGQILLPSSYTAYQLSHLKAKTLGVKPSINWFSFIISPTAYGKKTAQELNDILHQKGQPAAQAILSPASLNPQPIQKTTLPGVSYRPTYPSTALHPLG